MNPIPFLGNKTIEPAIQMFLATFCILLQNGGYSAIRNDANKPYGHFDGFERFGDSFETYAYAFAGIYSGLVALAVVGMAVLQSKKVLSKWQESSAKRNACTLFESLRTARVDRAEVPAVVALNN